MLSPARLLPLLLLLSLTAPANADEPEAVIRETSSQLLARLDEDAVQIRSDATYLLELLDQVLVPKIDERQAARRVLEQHWKEATEEQRERFSKEFLRYILRFYAQVFRAHAGKPLDVDYGPAEVSENGRSAIVDSTVRPPSGKPTTVRYRLRRSGDGWRVVDVVIDGVSLVDSNRKQFAPLINRDGLEAVIGQLAERNSRPLR